MSDVILRPPPAAAPPRPQGPLVPLGSAIVVVLLVAAVALWVVWDPRSYSATSWRLQSVSDDGRTLTLVVDPDCGQRLEAPLVVERPAAVTITARLSTGIRGGDDGCMPAVDWHTQAVTLTDPLGNRTLGGCGMPMGYFAELFPPAPECRIDGS